MEQLYRWVNMPTLPKEIGEYLVEYTNGRVEKIGYYPFPKESFYYGADGVNHLIKRWLEPIEESEHEEAKKYVKEILKTTWTAETFFKILSSKYHLIKK